MNFRALLKLHPPWWPAVAWMVVIFVASSIPGRPPGGEGPNWFDEYNLDKATHFFIYGLLSWLWAFAFRRGTGWPLPKTLAFAIVIATAYGATDEGHQFFVPGRYCSLSDWTADAIGALLGAAGFYWYGTRRRPKTS